MPVLLYSNDFGLFPTVDTFSNFSFDKLLNLINPSKEDALGVGYQLFQSKVAIGSGGILGKGLGEGTQSYLRFLPIKDSDFILSVVSEELGLFIILLLFI